MPGPGLGGCYGCRMDRNGLAEIGMMMSTSSAPVAGAWLVM